MLPTTHQGTRRLARDLVVRYGEDAALAARERAQAMEKIGNADAAAIWAAVTEILRRFSSRDRRMDA